MKLPDIILFSLAVAFFIIGVHQSFTVGLSESYWVFMLTIGLLFVYQLRKRSQSTARSDNANESARKRTPPDRPKPKARKRR